MNGEIVNYSRIARDCNIDDITVKNYFSILEDTLLGFYLEPFHRSIRKRQRESPKFYLFDTGVARALKGYSGVPLPEGSSEYGKVFEHFIMLEIKRLASYQEKEWQFSYLRTSGENAEVDLIIERPGMPTALIEIKSGRQVTDIEANKLLRFKRDFKNSQAFILSQEKIPRNVNGIEILPWTQGISELGL
jgi:predicted AAA+ superfamily ATPase